MANTGTSGQSRAGEDMISALQDLSARAHDSTSAAAICGAISGSVTRRITYQREAPPLPIQYFSPRRRQPAPSRTAVVSMAAASEPAPRSDKAKLVATPATMSRR